MVQAFGPFLWQITPIPLLIEEGVVGPVVGTKTNGGKRHDLAQEAGLDIALIDDHAVVVLQSRDQKIALLIQGEATGVAASSGGSLNVGQGAGCAIDGERNKGVRRDGSRVLGIEVGDAEEVLSARRHDEELLVGLFIFLLV